MLTVEERDRVLAAIERFGFLGRGVIETVRDEADRDLPFDLVARAVVEDPSARVRWSAVDLLDHYADDKHTDALIAALDDAVPRVRRHAAHALGCTVCSRSGARVEIDALERAARDSNAKVRFQARAGLATLRQEG
jgi:HEAT repeat protein